MASKVEIINRALTKLGETRILSPTDNVKPAREANSIWDTVLKDELRAHPWNFAIKRDQIAADVATPSFEFAYQYTKPSDCLRFVQIGDFWVYWNNTIRYTYELNPQTWYKIEGNKILTDLGAPLKVRYIQDITDPQQFDASFVEALACRLARELAEPLTQSNTKKRDAVLEYREAMKMAKRNDAIEDPPEPIPEGDWIYARF